MKRILILTIMFFNLLFGNSLETEDWVNKSRYARDNQIIMADKSRQVRVVLMGNSITEYWNEIRPLFFKQQQLVGRGISGQVSSQMLVRFRQDVINLKPRVVVINCGTNDIAENNGPYNEDITFDNILSMSELASSNGITVVLSSVLPCNKFGWNPSVQDAVVKIQSLNRRIIEYATTRGLQYIDYYSEMVVEGGALNPDYSEDGVHPNAAGYQVMERLLTSTLESLVPLDSASH